MTHAPRPDDWFDPTDRFDLYERAAQSPSMTARFLRALHAGTEGEPVTLGEDFSGAGAVSRAWLDLDPAHRAVCVDHDAEPLARLRRFAGDNPALTIRHADVFDVRDPAGVIAVLNFSICELRERAALERYLAHARDRLTEQAGAAGLLVLDLYGGVDAYTRGESDVQLRDGVRYIWEQREADPRTGLVVNAMHLRPDAGSELRNAFVYHWRLWSIPELRDALTEAGFSRIAIYDRLGDAIDGAGRLYPKPIETPDELDENYVVFLASWTR